MKQIRLIILFFIILSTNAFSQNNELQDIDKHLLHARNYALSKHDSAYYFINKLQNVNPKSFTLNQQIQLLEAEGLYYEIIKHNYTTATKKYLEAAKFCEENNHPYLKNIYHHLGLMFHTTDVYEKAKTYYEKVLILAKKENDKDLFTKCCINLGGVFSSMGNYTKAESYFREGLKHSSDFELKRTVYSNLGNLYIRQNQPEKALSYLGKATEINPETGKSGDIIDYSYLLDAKVQLKELSGIDTLLPKIQHLLKNASKPRDRTIMLKSLGKTFEALEDYKSASDYKNLYIKEYDSLVWQQQKDIVFELETRYDTQKKEEELQKRLKERNQLIVLSVLAGFIILVLCYLIYLNIGQKKKLSKQKIRLETLVEEKNTLLKETHHRVKNSFQIVSSLLYLQAENIKDKDAASAIKDAQNRVKSMILIHQKLYSKDQLTGIDTKEYIEELADDIINNQSNSIENLKIIKNIESCIFSIDTITPVGLIINELITNSLKYAFPHNRENPVIAVSFQRKGTGFELSVTDNGIGISNPDYPESFGLKLIHSLAKKLKANVTFENNNGTQATIFITKFEELT